MLEVLASPDELKAGRRLLRSWGADLYPSPARRAYARIQRGIGRTPSLLIPDWRKGWEIAKTIEFLRARVGPNGRIIDLGCSNSEVVWALAKIGYKNLAGCDLDPYCLHGAFGDVVEYSVQDITHTNYPSSACEAITCMSVVEHGVHRKSLIEEIVRLLKPGGYFIFSTDYWPTGIDTGQATHFGLPWQVFSRTDLESFLSDCGTRGLVPVGALNWRTPQPIISWKHRKYSFIWAALRRGS